MPRSGNGKCAQCDKPLTTAQASQQSSTANMDESFVLLTMTSSYSHSGEYNPFQSATSSMLHGSDSQPDRMKINKALFEEEKEHRKDGMQAFKYADLSHHIQKLTTQHAHCSGLPIKSPTCQYCCDEMSEILDTEAARTREQKKQYANYFRSSSSSNLSNDDLSEKLRHYEVELAALQENLRLMEEERAQLRSQQQALHQDEEALTKESASLWDEKCHQEYSEYIFNELRDTALASIGSIANSTKKTRKHQMLMDAFVISQDGSIGTINSFRMGKSGPDEMVEWNEINAAFGETAFLLQTLSDLMNVRFTDYQVIPLGNFSKIVRTKDVRMEYTLHGDDQSKFAESHFNLGLWAWLTCINQLVQMVEEREPRMKFPYKIDVHKAKIHHVSILYKQQQTDAVWTKALKYALTDLKWLLGWAVARLHRE